VDGLLAAGAVGTVAEAGRGAGNGADAVAGGRGAGGVPGSAFMMLTGGIEDAVGN
jgi:hypothetical protein